MLILGWPYSYKLTATGSVRALGRIFWNVGFPGKWKSPFLQWIYKLAIAEDDGKHWEGFFYLQVLVVGVLNQELLFKRPKVHSVPQIDTASSISIPHLKFKT